MAVNPNYNTPDVTIIQEVVNPTTILSEPDLYPCIVGVCYQVVRDSSAGVYDGTAVPLEYPELIAEAVVDQSSVVVKVVKDDSTDTLDSTSYTVDETSVTLDADIIIPRLMADAIGTSGYVIDGTAVFEDLGAEFISWGVVPGDVLRSVLAGVSVDKTVSSVTSETILVVDSTFGVTQSDVDYQVIKMDHIGDGLGSTVMVSYRALRSDLVDVGEVESLADAEDQLGLLVPENPLGFGVYCAILNTGTKVKFYATLADTQSAHADAADILTSHEVYAIAPLSQLTSVVDVWRNHVLSMSDPSEKMERVVFINRALPLREVKVNVEDCDVSSDTGSFYFIDRPGASFQSNNVRNGDRVYFEDVSETSNVSSLISYVVREVISEDRIKVQSATDIEGTEANLSVCSVDYTRAGQATHLRDYASSIESKRVIVVWPDQVKVTPEIEQLTVPGYYLCAALAGAVSAYPSQQSFTRLRLSGFDNLLHSNLGFFTQSQLDTIASGGVCILVQQNFGSLPEVRHQLTTDMRALEYRELSIVKNVDLISKYLRIVIRPMAGSYNITPFFMRILRVAIESVFENLKIPDGTAGPHIISASVVSMEQNSQSPDRIDVIVDLVIPYPANDIRVTIRI